MNDITTALSRGAPDIFTEREIDLDIANARQYARYSTDDHGELRRLFRYDEMQGHQKGHLTRIGNQIDGWIITRHAPRRLDLDYIYPELKPDGRVRTDGPKRHWHGWDASVLTDKQKWMAHAALRDKLILTAPNGWPPDPYTTEQSKHVGGKFENNPDPSRFPKAYGDERIFYGGHGGLNTNELHWHQELPKYVFSANPKHVCWHDHSAFDGKPDYMLRSHLRKHDADRGGRHSHWVANCVLRGAGTFEPCPAYQVGLAMRIDVHPMAEDLILAREVVFFVIEGCLKADAILSAEQAVFSVPSVWMWLTPDLAPFIRAYRLDRGKTVVIVPDEDWARNDDVLQAATLCQDRLDTKGVNSIIAAPPLGGPKGVDDFLGAGGKIGDMHVITYQPDPLIAAYVDSFPLSHTPRKNALRIIKALAIRADREGQIKISNRKIGRIVDRHPTTVESALKRLEDHGAITRFDDQIQITPAYRAYPSDPARLADMVDL